MRGPQPSTHAIRVEEASRVSNCSRRTFLEAGARLGVGALVLAQLPGCGGGATDGSVTPMNGEARLGFTQFPQLQTIGGGVVVDAGGTLLVVIRTGESTAAGLSAVCTHAGCTVSYVGGNPPIDCGCHGSTFSASGAVVNGPARASLRNFAATVDATGVTVTLA
jgi:cytochrome b6-f complex iron-sulfur subunit